MHIPQLTIYGFGRHVHLWHFPWPKRLWPKCPGRNVLGRNVRGQNVLHSYKIRGFTLLILSHFSLQIYHENDRIWSHLIFIGYVKKKWRYGGGGGSSEPPEPPLHLPLPFIISSNVLSSIYMIYMHGHIWVDKITFYEKN